MLRTLKLVSYTVQNCLIMGNVLMFSKTCLRILSTYLNNVIVDFILRVLLQTNISYNKYILLG